MVVDFIAEFGGKGEEGRDIGYSRIRSFAAMRHGSNGKNIDMRIEQDRGCMEEV